MLGSESSQDFLILGRQLAHNGTHQEAQAAYYEAWRLAPSNIMPLVELAKHQRSWQEMEQAHLSLSQALEIDANNSYALLELGYLFHQTGQLMYALQYFKLALQQNPEMADAWHQLGRLLQQLERQEQAKEAYQEAVKLSPNDSVINNSLGLLYYFEGAFAQAIVFLQKSVDIKPDNGFYHLNLGMALLQGDESNSALVELARAVDLSSELAQEVYKIGEHFFLRHQFNLAIPFYKIALKGDIDQYLVHVKLARCIERECNMQEVLNHLNEAVKLNPERWLLRIYAGLLLPHVYHSHQDILDWRERFFSNLKMMFVELKEQKYPQSPQSTTLNSPVFQLAYQGIDNLELLESLSLFWRHLLKLPATSRKNLRKKKKRIGFLSCYFFPHSVTGTYLGLIRELARSGEFELYAFAVDEQKQNEVSQEIKELCKWHVLSPKTALPNLAKQVIEADLDVLIYPELGLEPITYLLSQARLAPVQAMLFGHPSSSGTRTIDFFLSPDCFEPENGEEHYTETLVRLSGFPFLHPRPKAPRESFNPSMVQLPTKGHIYLIPGTLFKVHPDHDALFQGILEQDPLAQIVLIKSSKSQWHTILKQRFERSLGKLAERIHFIPWLKKEQFYALLQYADVVMDTIHFGSGNVAFQAIGLGIPIISYSGAFARGRMVLGLYQLMGVRELTAYNKKAYIELAVRMATQKNWKNLKSAEVLKKSRRIFDNPEDYAALAKIIDRLRPAQ